MLKTKNMQQVTYNTMPEALQLIAERLEKVEQMLTAVNDLHTQQQPENELLTIQGAAEFLRLSVPTIYAKVNRRELPFMKRSKRLYFDKTELLAYLKKGRALTTEEAGTAAFDLVGKKGKGLNNGN
jgi:excisionase family DNA binding protein